jgi:hypothetical protein
MTRQPSALSGKTPATDVPIACSVTTDQAPARVAALVDLVEHSLVAVDQTGPLTATLEFRNDPDSADRVAAFVKAESACCPFFQLDLVEAEGLLRLHVSAPAGAETMVTGLVGAFRAPSMMALPLRPDSPQAPGTSRTSAMQRGGDETGGRAAGVRRAFGLGAMLGVACLACLIPGIIAGGALLSGAALLSEARDVAAIALIATGVLVAYALLRNRRSRRPDGDSGCGC